MTDKYRTKVLKSVIDSLEEPELYHKRIKRISLVISAISWLGLFVSFLLAFRNLAAVYVPIIASIAGIFYGRSMRIDSNLKNWQVVAEFIDLQSVKRAYEKHKT